MAWLGASRLPVWAPVREKKTFKVLHLREKERALQGGNLAMPVVVNMRFFWRWAHVRMLLRAEPSWHSVMMHQLRKKAGLGNLT